MAEKKIRWGVIGAGGIADRKMVPEGINLANNAKLVGVMDIDIDVAKTIGRKYNVSFFATVENLLSIGDLHAVYVGTPNYLHHEQTIQALKARINVLVEKPMALNGDEAHEMVELANTKGILLLVDFPMRYNLCNQRVRELLPQIGIPVNVEMFFGCWYPCDDNNIAGWRWDCSKSGGGVVMDLVPHCVDLLRWWFGKEIDKVTAIAHYAERSQNIDETIAVILSFEENPLIATVNASYMVSDGTPSHFLIRGTEGYIEGWETLGQEPSGRLEYTLGIGQAGYDAHQKRKREKIKPQVFTVPPVHQRSLYQGVIEDASKAILTGQKCELLATGRDGLECTLVCDAIIDSLERQIISFVDR